MAISYAALLYAILDRINRMNRIFFAFPEERQKGIIPLRGNKL
jgi:hypothetical protein